MEKGVDDVVQELESGTVPPELCLWLSNGRVIRSLKEMKSALEEISQDCFDAHFHEGKNDFADWVRDVVANKELAARLAQATTKAEMIELLRHELEHEQVRSLRFEKPAISLWIGERQVNDIKGLRLALSSIDDDAFQKSVADNELDIPGWLADIGEKELSEKCANSSREDIIQHLDFLLGIKHATKREKAVELPFIEKPRIEVAPKVKKLILPKARTDVLDELKGLANDSLVLPKLAPLPGKLEEHLAPPKPIALPNIPTLPVIAFELHKAPVQAPPALPKLDTPVEAMIETAASLVRVGRLQDAQVMLAGISLRLESMNDHAKKQSIEYSVLELETDIKLKALG